MSNRKIPKWIKVGSIAIFILSGLIRILIYLGKEEKPVFKYDSTHSIYFTKDQFEKRFLTAVGDTLKSIGYFTPNTSSDIILTRSEALGDTVSVAFIIDPTKLNNETKDAFKLITSVLKPLMKTHIKLEFVDSKFNLVDYAIIE